MSLGHTRRSTGTSANHRHAVESARALRERERLRSCVRTDVVPGLDALADPSAAPAELIAHADRRSRRLRSQIEPRDGDDALFGVGGFSDPVCIEEREWVRHFLHDTALNTLEYIASDGFGEGLSAAKIATVAGMVATDLRTWTESDAPQARGPELLPALERVTQQARECDSRVELVAGDVQPRLSPKEVEAVVGAVREAINNARKHANAKNVIVRVECSAEGETAVTVTDDGTGIDRDGAANGGGLGVKGSIIGRMERVGGRASLQGAPGGGTRVTLVTPSQKGAA